MTQPTPIDLDEQGYDDEDRLMSDAFVIAHDLMSFS